MSAHRIPIYLLLALAFLSAHLLVRDAIVISDVAKAPPPDSALSLFAGAFRPIVQDVLWLRLEMHERAGRHEEMVPLARILLALDPRSQAAWWILGATIGTDTPAFEDDPDVVWRWRRQGILILAEGARRNPASWFLRHRMALLLEHQVGEQTGQPERFQADRIVNPEGLTPREAARRLYRESAAIPGHPRYVEEALKRIERQAP